MTMLLLLLWGTHIVHERNRSQFESQRQILISELSRWTGDRKWKELFIVATSCLLCYLAISICWPFGTLAHSSQSGLSSFLLTGLQIPCSPQ
jgi:hypothetical protein